MTMPPATLVSFVLVPSIPMIFANFAPVNILAGFLALFLWNRFARFSWYCFALLHWSICACFSGLSGARRFWNISTLFLWNFFCIVALAHFHTFPCQYFCMILLEQVY